MPGSPDVIDSDAALEYHRGGRPGKIQVVPTKPTLTQRDLSLAYTPGVAQAVREIARDPLTAFEYTARGNLVAVITNGSAILGLGNQGPLAAKPVMEGKALLFKRFADIDVFDLEINAPTVDEMIAFCRMVAPTFGGINLEDIGAPACSTAWKWSARRSTRSRSSSAGPAPPGSPAPSCMSTSASSPRT